MQQLTFVASCYAETSVWLIVRSRKRNAVYTNVSYWHFACMLEQSTCCEKLLFQIDTGSPTIATGFRWEVAVFL
jgi:hypothetical protein